MAASSATLLLIATCAPGQPLGHLLGGGVGVQHQFVEAGAQRRQVEVAEVERGMVEEDGAIKGYELYLFRRADWSKRSPGRVTRRIVAKPRP